MTDPTRAALARLVAAVFRLNDEWGCHDLHKESRRREMIEAARAAQAALGAWDESTEIDAVREAVAEAIAYDEALVADLRARLAAVEAERDELRLDPLHQANLSLQARIRALTAEQTRCMTYCRCGCHA